MYVGSNDSPHILCQRNVCRVQWFSQHIMSKKCMKRVQRFSQQAVGVLDDQSGWSARASSPSTIVVWWVSGSSFRSKHSSKASPQETKRQRSSQSLASNKFKSPHRQCLKFGQNPPQAAKKHKLLRQLQIVGYPKLLKLHACQVQEEERVQQSM